MCKLFFIITYNSSAYYEILSSDELVITDFTNLTAIMKEFFEIESVTRSDLQVVLF